MFLSTPLFFSGQAFSKHNYFNEYCSFESNKGEIGLHKSNYWDGYHMILNSEVPGIDNYPEVYLPGEEGSGEDPVNGNEAIVFSVLRDFNQETTPYDDGCWQGFTKKFERTVKVEHVSPSVSEILILKKQDELEIVCNYEHLVMTGDICDEL
jgi:hypothetical protein